ncbi:mCG13112 [Mus musculus]|nr:mCG13112 [Mus musculus]
MAAPMMSQKGQEKGDGDPQREISQVNELQITANRAYESSGFTDHLEGLWNTRQESKRKEVRQGHRGECRKMGSKSQNCLWNSLIDGLTGNIKEKPRPTIVQDTRPPEEILADELPQLDSPEALVKTSFRFGG